jgi:TRAP-type mannitol/chloroaromatic compound transport system substrate-binding protein
MDRRHFLAASSVLSATLLGQAAQAQTDNAVLPHVNWRMSSSFAPERDVIFDSALLLADVMRQLTAGRFNIEVHGAYELAPIGDNFIKTKEGWFECAHTSLSLHSADEPSLSLMGGVPFGMNGRQLSSFLLYGGGQDAINDILSEHHLLAFACGSTGAQMCGWFRSELRSLADLRGHKCIASGVAAKVLQRLGAQPKNMPDDLKAALSAGSLDSVPSLSPYDDEKSDIVKLAPNYYYPGWWQGTPIFHLIVNNDAWSKLPLSYQAALRAACALVHQQMMAHYDAINPSALRHLVEAGAKLKLCPQDIIDAGLEATRIEMAQMSANDPKFKRLYDIYAQFRYNAYLWWQVAEYSYDNMNIRERFKG